MPPDPKYAIVPRFADWQFPHGNLPECWKQCEIPRVARALRAGTSIVARDVSCRITAHREGTEIAHLVPASEAIWFNRNAMRNYATVATNTIDDKRNLILLRSDLHSIFDARNFAIVPKLPSVQEKPVFVVHVLASDVSSEIVQLYHNVPLQPLTGIRMEFLFARYAWTIIRSANSFLGVGLPRALRVLDGELYKTQVFSPSQCMELGKPTPSGSTSPKKRKAATNTDQEELEEGFGEGLDLDALEEVDKRLEALEEFDFEACRSRKRQRTSSSWSSDYVMDNGGTEMWTSRCAIATN
jgi:HNH endonuclease